MDTGVSAYHICDTETWQELQYWILCNTEYCIVSSIAHTENGQELRYWILCDTENHIVSSIAHTEKVQVSADSAILTYCSRMDGSGRRTSLCPSSTFAYGTHATAKTDQPRGRASMLQPSAMCSYIAVKPTIYIISKLLASTFQAC